MGQLSLSGNFHEIANGHYRSKLFTTTSTTNKFVSAAGPIFSLLERLHTSATLPSIAILRENIEHELRAFLSNINSINHTSELDAIAYYLLCATIDELL